MNARLLLVSVALLFAPAAAAAQDTPVSIHGAAGTNLTGGGHSVSASLGLAAGQHVEFLISAERNHLPTDVDRFVDGFSATRGGTTTFVSGEVHFVPLTFRRISPYGLVGIGRGTSRPNVNELFPDVVENDATMFFAGGGVRFPVTNRFSAFVDVRFVMQEEAGELGAFNPIRGGVTWRF